MLKKINFFRQSELRNKFIIQKIKVLNVKSIFKQGKIFNDFNELSEALKNYSEGKSLNDEINVKRLRGNERVKTIRSIFQNFKDEKGSIALDCKNISDPDSLAKEIALTKEQSQSVQYMKELPPLVKNKSFISKFGVNNSLK